MDPCVTFMSLTYIMPLSIQDLKYITCFLEAVSYEIHLFPHIYVFSISSRDTGFSVWFTLQKLIIIFL